MDLDLRQLLQIARRRWWIVVLLMAVAGASAYVSSSRQEDQFSATAKLLVISGKPDTGSDYSSLQASRSLAETYRQLIEMGPVLDRVIATLSLPMDSAGLGKKITTSVVGDTQIVQVSIVDNNPELAALIANTLVTEFRSYITDQIDPRIGAQVEIADSARIPKAPFAPQPMRSLILGMFVGALLGGGLVALLEFLDNTVKPETDFQELVQAPVMATIAELQKLESGAGQLFTLAQSHSSASESMRLLRANLDFASASAPIEAMAISSTSPQEGKSTITSNLGVVLAQSGMTVAIIDADLRHPTQHRIFSVENTTGLTTLLTNPEQAWYASARKVAVPNLYLVPSGPVPPNPTDLLSTDGFRKLIAEIRNDVDMLLIDTPPILLMSDPLIVANATDGLLLVCQSHKTRIDALRQTVNAVRQGNIRLVGVVLNRQTRKRSSGGYYDAYYYGSYAASQVPKSESTLSS